MLLADLRDARVVVWGAGLEALAAATRLAAEGGSPTVAVDLLGKRGTADLDQAVAAGLAVCVEEDARKALCAAEWVVASPSIPPSNPLWQAMADSGVQVTTTTDLWFAEHGGRTIAITGSKGKSTTTTLVAAVLRQCGLNPEVGGNIGRGFFDLDPAAELFVVEVGSNQSARLAHSPKGGVLTALFPEHLDWHGSVDAYVDAKFNLFSHGSQFVVMDSELATDHADRIPPSVHVITPQWSIDAERTTVTVNGHQWPVAPALLREHNAMNVALAVAAVSQWGVDGTKALAAGGLVGYSSLDHRQQVVSTAAGMEWVDDSLATSPTPVTFAIKAFADRATALIVGGLDRGVDYAPLVDAIIGASSVCRVYLLPGLRDAVETPLRARWAGQLRAVDSIGAAVADALSDPIAGGVVLFSPGAPSDGSQDYVSRSREFVAAIGQGATPSGAGANYPSVVDGGGGQS